MARARDLRLALPALLVGGAGALRLPALLAGRHLSFDDGVFGASAVAMRHGALPFRDVFSSQGPLFLPLVRAADLLGAETASAPRLAALVAGMALVLVVYAMGARLAGRGAGLAAGALVAVSGSVLFTTGPLAADGPALALGSGSVAVALAYRDRPSPWRALAAGMLLGAAFSVKNLFAGPPGLAVAWVLLERRRPRDLAAATGGFLAVAGAAVVPFGLRDVWDQSVRYHLDAPGGRTPVRNLAKVVSTLGTRDLPVLVAFVAAGLLAARGRTARLAPVVAWLAGVVAVDAVVHPLWRPHLAHAVPPAALFATTVLGRAPPRVRWAVAALVVAALPVDVAHAWSVLHPHGYRGAEARAVADLRSLPPAALAISDEPGLLWRAGRRTPPDLVDTSVLRVTEGRITGASLARAAAHRDVCAVLVWSSRFARLDLTPRLGAAGYTVARSYGADRLLYLRPCRTPTPRPPGAFRQKSAS